MKIGILTVYSFNYGSYFQATSLYKKLESMGYECEFINERFKQYRWGNLFLLYTFDRFVPGFAKPLITKILPQYETYLRLQKDIHGFKESPKNLHAMEKITNRYDVVVLGADEMWSATKKSIRYMPEHFGYRISCPHITYATCGSLFDVHNKKLVRKAANGMRTYDSIAVRDSFTQKLAQKLTKKEVSVVLDPTLLHPYFIDPAEFDDRKEGDYILLYGQHYSEKQIAFIQRVSQKSGKPIKALGWPQDFSDGFLDPETAEEFQKCFAGAYYCFPSTFHGTIFSILHHKPFLSMTNELRGKKVRMLLNQLHLQYRIFDEEKEAADESDYGEIDYDRVEEHLSKLRRVSEQYLITSLQKFDKNPNSGLSEEYKISSKCVGCSACTASCPQRAISMEPDEKGFQRAVIHPEKCVKCNICRQVCPCNNKPELHQSEVYGAFSKDSKHVMASSSGGIFGELAKAVLDLDGSVYGAAYTFIPNKNIPVSHIKIEKTEDLKYLYGSKYVQSNLKNTFSEIVQDLKQDKYVLFSGTPCQVGGLRNFIANVRNCSDAKLFTVDILCHGVPSPKIFADYLNFMEKKMGSGIKTINFRNKEKGWRKQSLSIDFYDHDQIRMGMDQDPYYILYFKNICLRPECYECDYISRDRVGDLTLGDFWGAEETKEYSKEELRRGISYFGINSEKGAHLADLIKDHIVQNIAPEKNSYQPLFDRASKAAPGTEEFWQDYKNRGYSYVQKKYARLSVKDILVKKIIAPITRATGIYKFAQKVYFVFSK